MRLGALGIREWRACGKGWVITPANRELRRSWATRLRDALAMEFAAWVAIGALGGVLSIIGGGNVIRGAMMAVLVLVLVLVVAAVVWASTRRW